MLKTKNRINLKEGIRGGIGAGVSGGSCWSPLAREGGCGRAGNRDVGAWRRWEPLAPSFPALAERGKLW